MQNDQYKDTTSEMKKFATVFGSPGVRVRFVGFFNIFWPFLIVLVISGFLLHGVIPVCIPPLIAGSLLVLLALVAWGVFIQAETRFASFLKGARGEEIVAREMSLLPVGWDVFHGINRAGVGGCAGGCDFDHIIVGPDTLFVIETKYWEGPITLNHGELRLCDHTLRRSPVAQVRREAIELATILKDAMPEGIVVTPIICFAGNNFDQEEGWIDDVNVCNARMIRNVIMEASGGTIDAPHRKLILEALTNRLHE